MKKLLLIDDDENLCRVLAHQLGKMNFQVDVAQTGEEGLKKFKPELVDVVLTDINLPGISGMDVIKEIRQRDRNVVIIIITAFGSVENAVAASKIGADDYLIKPFGKESMRFVIEKALRLRELHQENLRLKAELSRKFGFSALVGRSPRMEALIQMATRIALSESTVLILGESGTGKELLARGIHANSSRRDGPFVTVNCPSIPEQLLESELFGHMKGSFTGALKDRRGKFEMAAGGTIFLDEIGDLKFDLQSKLLRVLQEREIERVGESKPIPVDVRIIAATNKNLEQMMKRGEFREDLYYRLRVLPLEIPPLRERREDIIPLVHHFIKKYAPDTHTKILPETLHLLEKYDWPGNVRELENVIERAVVLCADGLLSPDLLPPEIQNQTSQKRDLNKEGAQTLPQIEERAIREALEQAGGNRTRAAKHLGIARHVLLYRLKKYGIES